jgi:hypothetical protein
MSREPAPRIEPPEIRYIKLGQGGCWVDVSLARGELHFGFSDVPHAVACQANVDEIRAIYLAQRKSPGTATSFAREVMEFYTQPQTTLWVTFARDQLWWCFAQPEVIPSIETRKSGARIRKTIDGWHHRDRFGRDLRVRALSSRLTKTAAFRATICQIEAREYLLRRINGDEDPLVSALLAAQIHLRSALVDLIRQLHWRDFETLVDLIFARLGWQRTSILGETMPDIDLVLEQPATGERGVVQVKSAAGQEELDQFDDAVRSMDVARAWFVVHSMPTMLDASDRQLEIWGIEDMARAVQKAGLVEWLVDRFG